MRDKILIIDDSEFNIEELTNILMEKYDIASFDNAIQSLEYLKTNKVNVILVDLYMPEMDGLDFLKEIKNYDIQTPIIIITPNNDDKNKRLAFDLGAVDYIDKPFNILEIQNKILIVLNNSLKQNRTVIKELSIFDNIKDLVIIIDDSTDEIIYVNEGMKKASDTEFLNKKCYKALYDNNERCKNCRLKEDSITFDDVRKWEVTALNNKHLLITAKLAYYDKRIIRVIYAEDLTLLEKKDEEIKYALKTEKLLNTISFNLINSNNIDDSINELLKELTRFYSADRAYIFNIEDNKLNNTFEYCKENIMPEKDVLQKLPLKTIDICLIKFFNKEAYHLESIEEIKEKKKDLYYLLKAQFIFSIILCPIFYKSDLVGFIGLDNPSTCYPIFMENNLLSIANLLSTIYEIDINNKRTNYDKLTNLYTFPKFTLEAKRYIKENPNENLSLIKFDINNFGFANKYLGIKYANDILIYIATIISQSKKIILKARLIDSDTFYLLINLKYKGAKKYILNEFLPRFDGRFEEFKFSFNFGIYEINDKFESVSSMLNNLTFAHKESRKRGFNYIYLYNRESLEKKEYEQLLINIFDASIKNNDFTIFIQPKYDLEQDIIYGGEVLVRLNNNGKLLYPSNFVEIYENNGYVTKLDRFVLIKALLLIKHFIDNKKNPPILSINYSKVNFHNKNIFEETLDLINKYEIPCELIQFEISQNDIETNNQNIINFTRKCKKYKITVVIDNYTKIDESINTLKMLGIKGIKVDYPSILKKYDNKRIKGLIESFMIDAKNNNLFVIIKGIENSKDAKLIKELRVRFVQGYYFNKPLTINQFKELDIKRVLINQQEKQSFYQELISNNSNLNKLFNNSIIPAGIYKYSKNKLYPIYRNMSCYNDDFVMNNFIDDDYVNLFDYINPLESDSFNKYLLDVSDDTINAHLDVFFVINDNLYKYRLKAFLIEKLKGEVILYMEYYKL